MERLPEQFERASRNAGLDRELARIPGIAPQARDERVTGHAHHLYVMRYDDARLRRAPPGVVPARLTGRGHPLLPRLPPPSAG